MTKTKKVSKLSVATFFMAREYHHAANALFPIAKDVASAIYFLYTHTLELACFAEKLNRAVERHPRAKSNTARAPRKSELAIAINRDRRLRASNTIALVA